MTNGEYLRFVEQGGAAPLFWRLRNGAWHLRRMFDEVPLPLDAPVYATHRTGATRTRDGRALRFPPKPNGIALPIGMTIRRIHGAMPRRTASTATSISLTGIPYR